MKLRLLVPALAGLALSVPACGDEPREASDPTPAPTSTSTPSDAPGVSGSASSAPTSSSPSASGSAPAENPLLALPLTHGWPTEAQMGSDGSVTGPAVELKPPLELMACGRTWRFDAVGRVDVRLDQPEDYRSRAVATYPDESEANAAASTLVSLYRSCPSEDFGTSTGITEVNGDPAARQGARITRHFEHRRTPVVGVESIVVFQRGLTVLVSLESNEGSGPAEAKRQASTQVAQLQPVLADLPS